MSCLGCLMECTQVQVFSKSVMFAVLIVLCYNSILEHLFVSSCLKNYDQYMLVHAISTCTEVRQATLHCQSVAHIRI